MAGENGVTRGNAVTAAPRKATAEEIERLMAGLQDARWQARTMAIQRLGDAGGCEDVPALKNLALHDSEWRVRESVGKALTLIGGAEAVTVLIFMAEGDPHPAPACAACKGMGKLAQASWPGRGGPIRTRGAVRVRGASPSHREPQEAETILLVLDRIRASHPDELVRAAADSALAELDR